MIQHSIQFQFEQHSNCVASLNYEIRSLTPQQDLFGAFAVNRLSSISSFQIFSIYSHLCASFYCFLFPPGHPTLSVSISPFTHPKTKIPHFWNKSSVNKKFETPRFIASKFISLFYKYVCHKSFFRLSSWTSSHFTFLDIFCLILSFFVFCLLFFNLVLFSSSLIAIFNPLNTSPKFTRTGVYGIACYSKNKSSSTG